jgi:hypothetical protein
MWSRSFLVTGVVSGAALAWLTLAGIWWTIFIATDGTDSTWTLANASEAGIIGIILYPACWYALVYRKRNYSVHQTLFLTAMTYLTVCAAVLMFLFIGSFKPALELLAASGGKPMSWWLLLSPFLMLFYGIVFAIFIGIAYATVAVPAALIHRYGLLKVFG